MVQAAQDLAANGYYTVIGNHRLAPCGLIDGQACHNDPLSGRPDQQRNDVKALLKALRADSHTIDDKIGVVGGSSGATHAMELALDKTATVGGVWPNWTATDRAACAVGLSGGYDFSDRAPEIDDEFIKAIENYTNTCDLGVQKSYSPISLITYSNINPILLMNSEHDPMPYRQILDIQCRLQAQGVSTSLYQIITIPGSDQHAFNYWDDWDGAPCPPGPCYDWGHHVIIFLDAHLK